MSTWARLWWDNTHCPWWSYPHQYLMQQGRVFPLIKNYELPPDTSNVVMQGIRALEAGQRPTVPKEPQSAVADIADCMQTDMKTEQDRSKLHFLIHILLGLWQEDMEEVDRQVWQQALDSSSLNLVIKVRHDIEGFTGQNGN